MLTSFYKQILTHIIILLKSSKKTKKYRNFADFAKNSTLEEYKDDFFKAPLTPQQELSFYVKSLPVCSDDKIFFFLENVHKANMSQYFLESLDKKNIAIHIYENFKDEMQLDNVNLLTKLVLNNSDLLDYFLQKNPDIIGKCDAQFLTHLCINKNNCEALGILLDYGMEVDGVKTSEKNESVQFLNSFLLAKRLSNNLEEKDVKKRRKI